jgi:hypothetical protein
MSAIILLRKMSVLYTPTLPGLPLLRKLDRLSVSFRILFSHPYAFYYDIGTYKQIGTNSNELVG